MKAIITLRQILVRSETLSFYHQHHHPSSQSLLYICIISLAESGHYVYVEAELKDEPASATLYLPVIATSYCLRFWYYMFGELTPFLTAGTQNGNTNELVFIRNDSQGDFWHPAIIDLQFEGQNYNVGFKRFLQAI